MVTLPTYSGMMWNTWVNPGIGWLSDFFLFDEKQIINRLNSLLVLILCLGVEMVKVTQSRNQYRVTIPPEIMTAFGLVVSKDYDWIMIGGLPALRERK